MTLWAAMLLWCPSGARMLQAPAHRAQRIARHALVRCEALQQTAGDSRIDLGARRPTRVARIPCVSPFARVGFRRDERELGLRQSAGAGRGAAMTAAFLLNFQGDLQ